MKKSNLYRGALAAAIGISSLAALATLVVYVQNTGMTYLELWEQRIAGILPLPVLILVNSVIIGGIVGHLAYSRISKQISKLSDKLLQIERGSYSPSENMETYQEFDEIIDKITTLSNQLSKQASQLQNAVNERETLRIEAVSQERNRIARELHDSLSQQLFSIALTSSALCETIDDDAPIKQKIRGIEEMVNQAQSEVRVLLLNLRPIQLEGKSLTIGIRELLQELSAAQPVEIVSHLDEVKLEKGVEDQMFRILQEAISNTLRHGKAKQIEVRLRRIETFVILKVIDDGIGFDIEKTGIGSYGISTMNERALEIGGKCKVLSLPGAGTTIEVRVPLGERGK